MESRERIAISAVLLAAMLMSGCATRLAVTYTSDPPGAVLYQGQQQFGYTPRTLYYEVTPQDRKAGYKTLSGTSVRWASGANASVSSLNANLAIGLRQQYNFIRPDSYPGRDADIRFSLELERLRIAREQIDAQRSAALMQYFATLQQQNQQNLLNMQRQPINCTSQAFGNTINTNCY